MSSFCILGRDSRRPIYGEILNRTLRGETLILGSRPPFRRPRILAGRKVRWRELQHTGQARLNAVLHPSRGHLPFGLLKLVSELISGSLPVLNARTHRVNRQPAVSRLQEGEAQGMGEGDGEGRDSVHSVRLAQDAASH